MMGMLYGAVMPVRVGGGRWAWSAMLLVLLCGCVCACVALQLCCVDHPQLSHLPRHRSLRLPPSHHPSDLTTTASTFTHTHSLQHHGSVTQTAERRRVA